tara:strand:- start:5954 stop:6226 length:273 start_codon:yes stop_codon:yes gene_type:complete
MATTTKSRLNLRVQTDTLAKIREAAEFQGVDVTSFVLEAATTKARRIALEEKVLSLSPAEVDQVADLIASDREPSSALVEAARKLKATNN